MSSPAVVELNAPLKIANWRPLVHWLLAIPHMVVASVLGQVGGVLAIISWVAIVVTGRMPEGLANFLCLVLRYQARAYSYVFWLREPYPAFEFSMTATDPGGDPLRVDLPAQLEGRNRVTVGLRLLWAIPIAVYYAVVAFAAIVALVLAFFVILFTGRWPEGMRRFVLAVAQLGVRFNSYMYLLTDDYPPFSIS